MTMSAADGKHSLPILARLVPGRRNNRAWLTYEQFRYSFANAVSEPTSPRTPSPPRPI